jgi:hypothetical protein
MRHEESYLGRHFVVTTSQDDEGRWTALADPAGGDQPAVGPVPGETEADAHRAAVSAAVAAIDRSRTARGKP